MYNVYLTFKMKEQPMQQYVDVKERDLPCRVLEQYVWLVITWQGLGTLQALKDNINMLPLNEQLCSAGAL